MCSECPNFTLTPRVALSKPSILQTWVFYPVGDLGLGYLHKNFQLPGTPGNVGRKEWKFTEIPGNLNCETEIQVILMTINQAYLVALRATVTLTYIPVMTPGLYDTFPGPPETIPGHIKNGFLDQF